MSEKAEATIEADAEAMEAKEDYEASAENLKDTDSNNYNAKEHKNSENLEDEKNLEEYDQNSDIKEIYHDNKTITYTKDGRIKQINLKDSKNAASKDSLEQKLSS